MRFALLGSGITWLIWETWNVTAPMFQEKWLMCSHFLYFSYVLSELNMVTQKSVPNVIRLCKAMMFETSFGTPLGVRKLPAKTVWYQRVPASAYDNTNLPHACTVYTCSLYILLLAFNFLPGNHIKGKLTVPVSDSHEMCVTVLSQSFSPRLGDDLG